MIYNHLFQRVKEPQTVVAGLIGAGDFGSAIVSQGSCVPRLKIQVVADVNLANGRQAFRLAGIPEEDIAVCDNRAAILYAMETGKYVLVEDGMLLMDLPLDVITTCTRSPEAGAQFASEAIRHGKHVVMVDKEADSVVGPILKYLADRAGVVFTTDDGDEPGLLMGLVGWARSLGMEVLSGGNTHSVSFDATHWSVTTRSRTVHIPEVDRWAMNRIPEGQAGRYAKVRRRLFDLFRIDEECGDPMAHMAVAANGTGLLPDVPTGHRPVVTWRELPEVLCPVEEGGINHIRHTVDIPAIIMQADEEPNYGGSVYIVVTCNNQHAMQAMIRKGLMPNWRGTAGVLYRPYHLCGAETSMSILCAGLLGVPTGGQEVLPHVDIIVEARRNFKAGETFGPTGTTGWNRDFKCSLAPGFPVGPGKPLPFFMLEGNRLAQDVPTGTVFTWDQLEKPTNSALWSLRNQQDNIFFPQV
jgi:predicted homoserine dehydrogenase-like protein